MPILPVLTLQQIGLDTWVGATLLLGILTLIGLSYRAPTPSSKTWQTDRAEIKSKAYLQERRSNVTDPRSNYNLPASPGIGTGTGTGWTIEKTMRVMTSVVVLLAAIYIIIFDQEANADRQKWAFGAVGLVFGHWARR